MALQFVIVLAALVMNWNILPIGWIIALVLVMLFNLWLGVQMLQNCCKPSWQLVFNYSALAGMISFLGIGIAEMFVDRSDLDPFGYIAIGMFLWGVLFFLFTSFPVQEGAPKHLVYSVTSCVAMMCVSWITCLFDTLPYEIEKLISVLGTMAIGYFIISLFCFIISSCRR